jgi:hypothetical protein
MHTQAHKAIFLKKGIIYTEVFHLYNKKAHLNSNNSYFDHYAMSSQLMSLSRIVVLLRRLPLFET